MSWEIAVQLGAADKQPLFQQIAIAIATDIERGRLAVGTRLASSRRLALQLGVNRNTVIAAYDELCARGWIAIEPARGAFVVGVPGGGRLDAAIDHEAMLPASDGVGFDMPAPIAMAAPVPRTPNGLLLLGGVPELRHLPVRALARAYRAALTGTQGRRLVDYAHPQGNPRLRVAVAEMVSRVRGVAASADAIAIVRGSQQGLYLAARALIRAGDVVAVEELGYSPAWRVLELAGATLVPIPVDDEGLDVDALDALSAARHVRAVYLTPHHQYPTTVTLSPERRTRLLELARKRRMIVLEDDYDFDFHYDGRPVLPLAASDRHGVVVYFGTMSKCLAPGLRVGYVVAPPAVARHLAAYRRFVDGQGDAVLEHAIATLLEDGEIQRHTRRALAVYKRRRDALCEALSRRLPRLELRIPTGGMAVWAKTPSDVDPDAWVRRGALAGVSFQAGSMFRFDREPSPFLRLGFAACDEAELDEAVERMARSMAG